MNDHWIKASHAAKQLGISEVTLRKYVRAGDIIGKKESTGKAIALFVEEKSFETFKAAYNLKLNVNQYTKPEQAHLIEMLNLVSTSMVRIENLLTKQQETNIQILQVFQKHTALLHESTDDPEDSAVREFCNRNLTEGDFVLFSEVYDVYCESVPDPLNRNLFAQKLSKIGLKTDRKKIQGQKLAIIKGYILNAKKP
jgi:hypothetical protein